MIHSIWLLNLSINLKQCYTSPNNSNNINRNTFRIKVLSINSSHSIRFMYLLKSIAIIVWTCIKIRGSKLTSIKESTMVIIHSNLTNHNTVLTHLKCKTINANNNIWIKMLKDTIRIILHSNLKCLIMVLVHSLKIKR